MGQQQLLLIAIGVIVVGIAVVVGINLFNAAAQSNNRSAVVGDLNVLANYAEQYYKMPPAFGGGAGSFIGFDSTKVSGLTTTPNGNYTISGQSATQVTIAGLGTEKGNDKINPVKATCTVVPTSSSVVINN